MHEVMKFDFTSESQRWLVRVVMVDGEPWWVAKDVCEALSIGNSRMAISRLDEDERGVSSIDTLGGVQEIAIVNEPGLYGLILGSRKPETGNRKPETGNRKPETGSQTIQTLGDA